MEKISRIVGGSSRTAAVDLKNAPAVRPGTPSFGRPVGVSTRVDRDGMSTAQKAIQALTERDEQKKMDELNAKIAQQMAHEFFQVQNQPAEVPGEVKLGDVSPVVDEVVAAAPDAEISPEMGELAEEVKYTPKGTFVDVRA